MTTSTAKKKAAEAEAEAPVEEKPAAKKKQAETTTEFTFDGVRALDTVTDEDGTVRTVERVASFEEQIAVLAPLVLDQAVGIIHLAESGTVEAKGNVITVTLVAR